MNALLVSEVWFSYAAAPHPVLRGVSLSIAAGEAVALVGSNGAGKTTLTRLVMGLLHPSRGEILVAGVPNAGQAPEDIARDAAYVFQHPDRQLFARTVIEEVAFGPRQLGRVEHEARDIAFHALLRVGLEARAAVHPYDLPAAERKLVALAAALAQQPNLLILDEPTQGLDARHRDRVCDVILDMTEHGLAVLAVSHDPAFIAEATERILVLREGTIGSDAPTRQVLADDSLARALGLVQPPAARLSRALGLPATPIRKAEVIRGLRI
jgi:energy-coupling factor transporter ATP-binding protein EcfA2